MSTRLYPITTNTETLCRLAEVPSDTWAVMEKLETEINSRSTRDGLECYVPKADEIEVGPVIKIDEEGTIRDLTVLMPDGVIMHGNTSHQGEQTDDCSFIVYRWLEEYYPEVERLRNFLLFGWGRITFPENMEWSPCGSTTIREEIEDLIDLNIPEDLPGNVTVRNLEGLCWS